MSNVSMWPSKELSPRNSWKTLEEEDDEEDEVEGSLVPFMRETGPEGRYTRVWNSLPDRVTSAPSVAVFRSRLKTHLFNISYPSPLWLYSARAVTLSYFGH